MMTELAGTAGLIGTAGQTVGPFFHDALPFPGDSRLITETHPEAIQLHGVVYDGAGNGVPDALIEIWQPDSDGAIVQRPGSLRRDGRTFTGWGRAATDGSGHYSFTTLVPGSASAERPPFFAIAVFARGLLHRLFTRAYLPEGQLAADPLLNAVGADRRHTLVCTTEATGYRFDIHLQGVDETVFLDYLDGQP